MPDGSVPLLITLIALIIVSGFFSGIETAVSCSSRIKLRSLSTQGNKRANKVLILAEEKFDRFISAILIGNNIVNLTAATIATLFFTKILNNSSVSPSVVSTIVVTVVVLIFGEITPKFIAKTYPEKIAMFFYPLTIAVYYFFTPLVLMFSGWKWLISKLFRLKADDTITEEELMTMVEEAEEDGTIKKEETKLIRSVIEFDDLEVADILVPRVNMVAIEQNTSMSDILKIFKQEGFSRLPVYKNTVDTIVGIIHEKDFYSAYLDKKENINDILQDAFYTTEHIKISKLLKQFQKNKIQMAIVVDEYGGTLGVITLEDVLEELVGEIYDEHDEEVTYIKKIADDNFIIDCNAPLDDFFDYFNIQDENDNFDATTLSGFIIEYLGELPKVGFKFDFKNLSFEILKATVKRIHQVKLKVNLIDEN